MNAREEKTLTGPPRRHRSEGKAFTPPRGDNLSDRVETLNREIEELKRQAAHLYPQGRSPSPVERQGGSARVRSRRRRSCSRSRAPWCCMASRSGFQKGKGKIEFADAGQGRRADREALRRPGRRPDQHEEGAGVKKGARRSRRRRPEKARRHGRRDRRRRRDRAGRHRRRQARQARCSRKRTDVESE